MACANTVGPSPRIYNVKFLSPIVPAEGMYHVPVSVSLVRRAAGLDVELRCGAVLAMRGQVSPGQG